MKAILLKIAVWLFARSLQSLAEEYLDDTDALAFRTRLVEAIRARQGKLATKKGNGFVKARARALRFASIVLDSGRLRGEADRAAEVAQYMPQNGPGADRGKL